MGVNPSNRRLRASKNLTNYGSGGHRLTGGGFGLGNKGGSGFSIIRFRLFHKIKPKQIQMLDFMIKIYIDCI